MTRIPMAGLAAMAVLSACTVLPPGGATSAEDHARHHPPGANPPAAAKADQQMMQMREMHRKMRAARTPQERQALMAEHMKAMQGGMSMMCEMGAASPAGGAAPAAGEMMMKRCMEMKDMTMQMMLDRERAGGAGS